MEPITTAALIAGAASLGSTALNMFGGGGKPPGGMDSPAELMNWRKWNEERDLDLQLRQPSSFVEGWRRAGIHPLAAMGQRMASGPVFMTGGAGESKTRSAAAGLREAGQNVGNVIARMRSPEEKRQDDLQLRLLEKSIEKEDAQVAYIRSETAKNLAAPGIGAGAMHEAAIFGEPRRSEYWDTPLKRDVPEVPLLGQSPNVAGLGMVQLKAPEVATRKTGQPHVEAGTHAFNREYQLAPGFFIMLPTSDEGPAEVLNEMGPLDFSAMLWRNWNTYGEGWLEDFFRVYGAGKPPERNWRPLHERR